MRRFHIAFAAALLALVLPAAHAQENFKENFKENFASWPLLTSTFPSTGGGGYIIKGYDPVISGGKCITTFMATLPPNELYLHVAEYDAVPEQGGTLCTNGRWRSFDGKSSGKTPFRMFFKDGVFRGAPQAAK
jgi:hypothetical protein